MRGYCASPPLRFRRFRIAALTFSQAVRKSAGAHAPFLPLLVFFHFLSLRFIVGFSRGQPARPSASAASCGGTIRGRNANRSIKIPKMAHSTQLSNGALRSSFWLSCCSGSIRPVKSGGSSSCPCSSSGIAGISSIGCAVVKPQCSAHLRCSGEIPHRHR